MRSTMPSGRDAFTRVCDSEAESTGAPDASNGRHGAAGLSAPRILNPAVDTPGGGAGRPVLGFMRCPRGMGLLVSFYEIAFHSRA
jgi:hypothetical protein